MSFKLSKEQAAERDALAALLRKRAAAVNIAIAAFNRGVEPFLRRSLKRKTNTTRFWRTARTLASNIAEVAQEEFDANPRDGRIAKRAFRCEAGSSSGR